MNKGKKNNIKPTIIRLIPIMLVSMILIIYHGIFSFDKFTLKKIFEILAASIFAGFCEEYIFRKLLLGNLLKRNKYNYLLCIFLTGIIFGLLHIIAIFDMKVTPIGIVAILLSATGAGIMFGFAYYYTWSFLLCAFVHSFYDIAAEMSMVAIKDNETFTGDLLIFSITLLIILSFLSKNEMIQKVLLILGIILSFLIILF